MFYALSVDPWFNDKISVFVALAPVTKLSHSTSPALSFFTNKKKQLANLRKLEAVSSDNDRHYYTGNLARDVALCEGVPEICPTFNVSNWDIVDTEANDPAVFSRKIGELEHEDSLRTLFHFGQNYVTDRF